MLARRVAGVNAPKLSLAPAPGSSRPRRVTVWLSPRAGDQRVGYGPRLMGHAPADERRKQAQGAHRFGIVAEDPLKCRLAVRYNQRTRRRKHGTQLRRDGRGAKIPLAFLYVYLPSRHNPTTRSFDVHLPSCVSRARLRITAGFRVVRCRGTPRFAVFQNFIFVPIIPSSGARER
jgi:hypothetical protein